jgi:hypothetical protein
MDRFPLSGVRYIDEGSVGGYKTSSAGVAMRIICARIADHIDARRLMRGGPAGA